MAWWEYEQLKSGEPYDWAGAARGESKWDNIDFHLDLGCGRLKKGRLGIDRHPDPGVDLVMDLESLVVTMEGSRGQTGDLWHPTWRIQPHEQPYGPRPARLPFPDNSIWSIISHHALEHIDAGFVRLMDECWRVLIPGGIFRIIVPLFPSQAAVADPDHKRYFMADSFETFCGALDGAHWHESFSTPYTNCRFQMCDHDITPLPFIDVVAPDGQPIKIVDTETLWGSEGAREIRVALVKPDTNV